MHTLPTTIRPAVEADYQTISGLYRDSYRLHQQAHPESYKEIPEHPLARGSFISILEDADELLLVAERNGDVVGVVNASIEEDSGGRLHQPYRRVVVDEVSVGERERRTGIGSSLMQAVEAWAKEKGIDTLSVIVYHFNRGAVQFYETNGYQALSIRMNKTLRADAEHN